MTGDAISQFEGALAAFQAGRFDDAAAGCRRVLESDPGFFEAQHLLGVIAFQGGAGEDAVLALRRALELRPNDAGALGNLARVLKAVGQWQEAVEVFQRLHRETPGDTAVAVELGAILLDLKRFGEAADVLTAASEIAGDDAVLAFNLGLARAELTAWDAARDAFERVLAIDSGHAEAVNGLANACKNLGETTRAIELYRRALEIRPDFPHALNNLAETLKDVGRAEEAFETFERASAAAPADPRIHSNLLMCGNYVPDMAPEDLSRLHVLWGHRHGSVAAPAEPPQIRDPDPERPLRIGFVSPDFNRHPVGFFIAGPLANLSAGFEAFCYADGYADEVTQELKSSVPHWIDCRSMSDDELFDRTRTDGIDILVDLAGHTANNRLQVFIQRAAPVQVTWMGYVNTTGLDVFDALLGDPVQTPESEAGLYREPILRFSHTHLCYSPPPYELPVGPLPAGSEGPVTFGSFNNGAKLNDAVLALWASVLAAIPDSTLLLKYGGLDDPAFADRARTIFAENGNDPDRLTLEGKASHPDLLARYADIDIALDPFPYSGGLTTLEALWMGVPVITLAGRTFAGRHAAGYLKTLGLEDFVAETPEAFVACARGLALDRDRLATLRAGLRDRLAASPICDHRRFTAEFEEMMRKLWRAKCGEGG